MTFKELQKSLTILELDDRVTMQQVKKRHRDLVKRYHPDCCNEEGDGRQIELINAAYAIIIEYLEMYRFSFSEEEFYIQNPDENLRRQFMTDPLWGSGEES